MRRILSPTLILTVGMVVGAATMGSAQNAGMSRHSERGMMHRRMAGHDQRMNSADRMFLRHVSNANQEEIQSAKWIMQRINNSTQTNQNRWNNLGPLRNFANRMIDDHTAAQNALMRLARHLDVTLPTTLDPTDRAHMDALMQLRGRALYQSYIAEQRRGHEKVVALFKQELQDGRNSAVQAYARKNLPVIEEHLQMAASLSRNGFRAHRSMNTMHHNMMHQRANMNGRR